ncbi:hypothetical protein BDV18DRAFT_163876 [Aspergillus unguis]
MATKAGDNVYPNAMEWATAHGIEVRGVTPTEVPGLGLGMRATRVIEEDEIIVTVPSSAMITIDSIPKTFVELFPEGSSIHGILAAYLSHGDASSLDRWKEWRDTWPDPQFFKGSMPVSWVSDLESASAAFQNSGTSYRLLPPAASGSRNTEEKKLLDFNPEAFYHNILPNQEKRLRSAWDSVLVAFPGTDWDTFSYHWFIVNTRSFYYVAAGKDEPDDWNDAVGLVPIADYFNHANDPILKACMATFDNKGYTISATRRIEEGEEIYISYGTHSNDYLLIEYGFFLDHNPSDAIFLDDLIFKDLDKPELELLRNFDLHGDYKVTQNGPCSRTQKVACLTFMNPNKWREYILDPSVNGPDRETMTNTINGWVDTHLKNCLSTIRTLEDEPRLSILLKRWSQIRDLCEATLNGTKIGRGGNGRG